MFSWKSARYVVLSVALGGAWIVAAVAQAVERVSEPASEARVSAEPREIAPRPGPPSPETKPAPRGEQVNVRVDLKIRAQKGASVPVEKILALVAIGDDSNTAVRTSSSVALPNGGGSFTYRDLSLNADVRATVSGRRIVVALSLDYNFAIQATEGEGHGAGPTTSSVRNQIRVVLEDGKALVVSDQVDAVSDYRVTVEAKATILR